jgi:U3 small nucleolar RNA-associated protein 12
LPYLVLLLLLLLKILLPQVWDVGLQHCSQTLIGFKDEVWSLDADPQEQRLVAGCTDSELRVYAIRRPDEQAGTNER